jgi:site-specific DNA recombinase
MIRAALYARVSSKAQAEEDKVSISEQFAEMEAYRERHDYEIVQRYQDVASGATKRRPDFQRMLANARDGLSEVVVCWKPDRLSRGIYPASALMEIVEANQIRLEAVADTIGMKTFAIYAAVGKIELDNFRERATLGKRGAAKRGRLPVGSVPYGYRIGEDGRPEIDPIESPVIQRIFRNYVYENKGARVITRELTTGEVPMRKGSKWGDWSTSYIHRILSHPAYKGTNWYGRRRHVVTESGVQHISQPEDTWIAIPFPPLVVCHS